MIHTVKRYTFQATVTLAPPPAAGRRALPPPGQARRMTVRGRHHQTGRSQFFSAMLARNDQATPARKDAAILVTITITTEHAAGYFGPGRPLAQELAGYLSATRGLLVSHGNTPPSDQFGTITARLPGLTLYGMQPR